MLIKAEVVLTFKPSLQGLMQRKHTHNVSINYLL